MTGAPGFLTLSEVALQRKRVLVRVDYNVPLKDGAVADDTRIRATLPTIQALQEAGAFITLMSHLGRPKEGAVDPALSLEPIARHLTALLRQPVRFVTDWEQSRPDPQEGEVCLLENVRFLKGEKKNEDELARRLAALCDVYVNDAFATAHRAEASTCGVAKYAPIACAGPLLQTEVDALSRALKSPARPLCAIVAGAKVSTKLTVLRNLLPKVDQLIVGGGIANTFLKAAGFRIGKSLNEAELVAEAASLLERARTTGRVIPLPVDAVCAKQFSEDAAAVVKDLADIEDDDLIMDIGPRTIADYERLLEGAGTIVWNGPPGVFEFEQFSQGTRRLATAIAASPAFSIAGGGDTLAAIARFGIADRISYVSTGGGAFLEFLEGRTLPAIAILEEAARARKAAEREY